LFEHDLFPKTGSHFSGSCSSLRRVRDWPFSSFHRDVAAGLFPQDWAGELETLGEFGEARVAQ